MKQLFLAFAFASASVFSVASAEAACVRASHIKKTSKYVGCTHRGLGDKKLHGTLDAMPDVFLAQQKPGNPIPKPKDSADKWRKTILGDKKPPITPK